MEKKCSKCGEIKNIDQFYKDSASKSGISYYCKECAKKKRRAFYRKSFSEERKAKLDFIIKRSEWLRSCDPNYRLMVLRDAQARRSRESRARRPPIEKFKHNFKASLRRKLNGEKILNWEEAVGYTFDELVSHFEKLFRPGMSWNNYGRWLKDHEACWSIDHIAPLVSFDFSSYLDPGFKKCWRLDNLQPLWNVENFVKNCR